MTMNPPPARLPALGYVTASAKPVATAPSIALPPLLMICAPANAASRDRAATIPPVPCVSSLLAPNARSANVPVPNRQTKTQRTEALGYIRLPRNRGVRAILTEPSHPGKRTTHHEDHRAREIATHRARPSGVDGACTVRARARWRAPRDGTARIRADRHDLCG